GILVEHPQVGVGRGGVEEVVELLYVLAVLPLAVGEAEHPLLEDRIAAVPEREREAEVLMFVREPGEAVLAPAVGAAPGMIVGEVVPGGPVRAVVLPDRAPLAFGEVGAPPLPGARAEA